MTERCATPWSPFAKASTDSRVRLFCFAYAGGGATAFREWQKSLGPGIEVFGVQPPDRENRLTEDPLLSVGALVDALVPAILPWWELVWRGHPAPVHFFASGAGAPTAEPLVLQAVHGRLEAVP